MSKNLDQRIRLQKPFLLELAGFFVTSTAGFCKTCHHP